MGKKKSLGSSPIGFSSVGSNSYKFIRDLGVSSPIRRTRNETPGEDTAKGSENYQSESHKGVVTASDLGSSQRNRRVDFKQEDSGNSHSDQNSKKDQKKPPEKKIVSYYLELELIERLKSLADAEGSYYSAVVSQAIEAWVDYKGY